jgi:aminoglycoside phosphotransferase (APT) family kinase protein
MRNEFRSEEERKVGLTPGEQKAILGSNPEFRSIRKAIYFDNYVLPCPILVTVATDRAEQGLVLRKTRHGDVRREVRLLALLGEYGLPVPAVLAEPFVNEQGETAAVYSLLPGENLQKLSSRSEEGLECAKNLLIEAVGKLAAATGFVSCSEIGGSMRRETLAAQLASIGRANPWSGHDAFRQAADYLGRVIPEIDTPLVLTNGDYQPGNFLAEDGKLTGFLDFESAVFQDPLIGFAKYPIYDLEPLSRTDLIERFVKQERFTIADFNVRLALMCLMILKKEVPVTGGGEKTDAYRARILDVLKASLA